MTRSEQPPGDLHDVVVVGSGIGGLSAAALLAKAGKKVVVVERHDRPGGCAHGFERNGYVFDAAVHLIGGTWGLLDRVLEALDLQNRCTLIPVDPFYTTIFPDFRLEVPSTIEGFIAAHAREFPREEQGLRRLVDLCSRASEEMREFPTAPGFLDTALTPLRFRTLFKYRNATLAQALDEHLGDPRLKSVVATLWGYSGLPPSRVSFLTWALMIVSYLDGGVFYCQNGFQQLADAFVEALERRGGKLLLGRDVRKILVEQGSVAGVELAGGERLAAPVVIANSDARQTFRDMVGFEHLPREFVEKLERMRPSLSAYVLYIATNLDVRAAGASHEMFFHRSWDADEIYGDYLQGRPNGAVVTIPSLVDPSLSPSGEHVVTAFTLVPYDLPDAEEFGERLLDEVEAVCPGLRSHITLRERGSPQAIERFTGNPSGAIYGWEHSPDQAGRNRLDHRTPIRGLYLSGHWTRPGGGVAAVLTSGVQTVQLVLGYPSRGAYLASLS